MCLKATFRQQLRSYRRQLSPEQRLCEQQALHRRLLKLMRHRGPRRIASYCPMGAEIDPLLVQGPWRPRSQLYWPQIMRSGLRFASADPSSLRRSRVGAWEPRDSAARRPLWALPVAVLPLLGCDRDGYRLGQGGGYYDRALARCAWHQPLLVGVGFDCQLVRELPREAHDQPLDIFLSASHALAFTPKGHRWLTGY